MRGNVRHLIGALVAASMFSIAASAAAEQDSYWPAWRGPLGTGSAAVGASPPVRWTEAENVRWKTLIPGRGHSSPIVWGDRVFLTTAIAVGEKLPARMSERPGAHDNLPVDRKYRFDAIALDRATGELVWRKTLAESVPHEGGHYTASLASASPVTDGTHLIVSFGSRGIFCLDFAGKVLWERQLGTMHTKHGHGEGASPALFGDRVIVNWDHEEASFLAVYDKATGEPVWRKARNEVTSWSTPIVIEQDGIPQVVVCGTSRVRGYDLRDGEVIWECGGMSANIVATPVSADGFLYVGSSYEKRVLMAISLAGARGDITGSEHVVWERTRGTPYVPSPLLSAGGLYFLTHYQNVLTRVEAKTGVDAPGAMRLGGLGNIYASPVAAGGHVYVTDLDGVTQVITDSEIPRLVSVNPLGEKVSASAAIVDEQLLIRGEKHLFCIAPSD